MFEAFDATLLARLQFAFTVSFHFIFPSFTIGLASYLAVLEALWLWTGARGLSRPVQVLAEDLRPGVRHGRGVGHRHVLPVRHQLVGLLRQGRAGDRPADGLRGADRLLPRGRLPGRHAVRHEPGRQGPALRRDAAVAVGTFISAFWILSANSWMQTPAGYAVAANGQFVPADWLTIIFNPSLPLPPRPHRARRLSHDRAGGRRRRRLASAARAARPRARG